MTRRWAGLPEGVGRLLEFSLVLALLSITGEFLDFRVGDRSLDFNAGANESFTYPRASDNFVNSWIRSRLRLVVTHG